MTAEGISAPVSTASRMHPQTNSFVFGAGEFFGRLSAFRKSFGASFFQPAASPVIQFRIDPEQSPFGIEMVRQTECVFSVEQGIAVGLQIRSERRGEGGPQNLDGTVTHEIRLSATVPA